MLDIRPTCVKGLFNFATQLLQLLRRDQFSLSTNINLFYFDCLAFSTTESRNSFLLFHFKHLITPCRFAADHIVCVIACDVLAYIHEVCVCVLVFVYVHA